MREARIKNTSTVFPLTTDSPIIGFTEGSVIFIDALGTLAQDNANFFWDDTLNRLGIGTALPASTLDVRGETRFGSGTTLMAVIPDNANLTGIRNTIIGSGAGAALTSGSQNTALGDSALASTTTQNSNTAIGYNAMFANTTGFNNTAVGTQSLDANTTGRDSTAVGAGALTASTGN